MGILLYLMYVKTHGIYTQYNTNAASLKTNIIKYKRDFICQLIHFMCQIKSLLVHNKSVHFLLKCFKSEVCINYRVIFLKDGISNIANNY